VASSLLLRWGPTAAVALVFVALAIASPETLVVTAKNPLAWLFVAGVVALSVGITVVGTRVFHRPMLARTVGLIPVVAALVWGFLPAFQDEKIVDAAPVGLPAATTAGTAASTSPAGTTSATAAPTSAGPTSAAPTSAAPTSAAPTSAGPVELGSGELASLDYQASGVGRLIQLPEDELLVRFEGLDVENGPDYVVYLVPGSDQRAPGNGVFLGELQGNQGDQNYDVPAGTDASGPQTILIWCRSFAAPVANASVG